MRTLIVGRLALLMVPLIALLISAPTTRAASATATATGTPGVFEFRATGFEDGETVSTWVTGPSQQVQASGNYDSTSGGDVTFQYRVPRHFEPGRWAITIHGLDSNQEAIVYFDVAARGPDGTLEISQPSGPAGTTFNFASTSFVEDETVSYWLTGPDGKSYEGGAVDANGSGRVDFSFTIGAGTQPGPWMMSAYGQESDRLAVVAFTVT